ncbi:ribosomal-processing cysteine protease Prp [Abyssicoccus albus]|uniref:Ribosomal processing cysteine protease Prp n=1 Tax=Abyssicoccus albus TaxID=1817405 RepID=A0A1Q1G0X1_9BACL|nr:ribosomal-processing cysteine protease Prp [Abyssicoccus albus]AQL55995.1 hypothetical protein BVH56_03195 [Abyssicoccus albus]RPF58204.1 hypothetical protein EDD62_0846 [Abyssicoccus albus]
MINVMIHMNDDAEVTQLTMDGHADYDEYGKDLVCAGASAVVIGGINAIMKLSDDTPTLDMDEERGFIDIKPFDIHDDKSQLILQTIIVSLVTIQESYGEFINIQYK